MENPEVIDVPQWLNSQIDQRIALIEHKAAAGIKQFGDSAVVMTPLTEPREGQAQEEWERSCDNCGAFVPEGPLFFTGTVSARLRSGQRVVITFGACAACKDLP